ncbi:MAG: TIGR00180 family glycosyltransferase [Gemmatimonadales bacterium]|nr:TIGR00180 family glycosyltransferase [Gemmatimonadales bacterium]
MVEASNAHVVSPVALVAWCLDSLTAPGTGALGLDVDLSLLTVVVPSRNRQDYLLRQIRFWASSSASLIVVDGSIRPLDDRVRSAVDNHRRMTYLHEHSSFARRLNLAAALIETPYSVMLGDDEFHLPSGLGASLSVLEENPDLVGCMGQVLSFSPVGSYRRIVLARAYPSLRGYEIRHAVPADRLIAAMSEYAMATCYAVLRTSVWQRSWGALGEYGSGAAAELQQAMAVYLLGGLATTGHAQWLRSIENSNEPLSSTEEKDGKIWFPEWWEGQRYEAERVAFVGGLAELVADELGADRDVCASWVIAGAEVFVDENRHEYEFEEPVQRFLTRLIPAAAKMLRTVARCLPDPLFLGAKRWRGRVLRFLQRSGGNYYGTVEDLPGISRAEGLVIDPAVIDEIGSVEDMVREFHALRLDET